MNEQRVDVGATELAVTTYGAREAGPLVLLHGHADVALSLEPLAAALSEHFFVIAPDLRGHGHSDQPGAYSVKHHMGDVMGLLDVFEIETATLVGHSLGGQILGQFAGVFPDRCTSLVLAEGIGPPMPVATVDAPARVGLARQHVDQSRQPVRRRPMSGLDEAIERFGSQHPGLSGQRLHDIVDRMVRPGPDGGVEWRFDPRTREWLFDFDRERVEERWAQSTCPTLVLTGDEAWERWWRHLGDGAGLDMNSGPVPSEIDRKVAIFGDGHGGPAEHRVIAGAGHMIHYDRPQAMLDAVLEFLTRTL